MSIAACPGPRALSAHLRPAGSKPVREAAQTPAPPRATPHMPEQEQLEAWMAAVAQRADRHAFAALFNHFAPRIKGFLVRGGTEPSIAEELAQETMVSLWRKGRLYDPSKAGVTTWVYRIARNLRIDHHRRSKGAPDALVDDHEQWSHSEPLYGAVPASPDDVVLAAQREHAVRIALGQLSSQQQLLLRLSFFEEHAHSRISEELGIPLGTVKSRIRLALAQLRRTLDEKLT